jgi:hypothetical protein
MVQAVRATADDVSGGVGGGNDSGTGCDGEPNVIIVLSLLEESLMRCCRSPWT